LSTPARGLRRNAAAEYLGLSISKFDQLVAEGRLPKPKYIDTLPIFDRLALDAAYDALPGDEPNEWDNVR
jgi:hypothetical protein